MGKISQGLHDAVATLAKLRVGDTVQVTADGRTYAAEVARGLHRCDGAYGSYESSRVTVRLPNRVGFTVTAESMADGRQGIQKAA